MMLQRISSVVFLVAALAAAGSAQTTWHVQAGAAPPGTGAAATPFPSIQSGIAAASNGDLVLVGPGTYTELLDYLGKAIEVRGDQGAATTILGLAGQAPGVLFDDSEGPGSILRGMTIRDGLAGPVGVGGSAVRCFGTSPAISECEFIQNQRLSGGAVYASGGAPSVVSCTFRSNSGLEGGALALWSCVGADIADCHFESNTSSNFAPGGAVYASGGTVKFRDCTFLVNQNVDGPGGAVALVGVQATFDRCRFHSNRAWVAWGGAIWAQSGSVRLSDCTFTENSLSASYWAMGGAIHFSNAPGLLERCVLSGNRVNLGSGGGAVSSVGATSRLVDCLLSGNSTHLNIASRGGHALSGAFDLVNCTLSRNLGDPSAGLLSSDARVAARNCILWDNGMQPIPASATFRAASCDIQGGWPGIGNIDADPQFVNAAAGDLHIGAASPCRNAGSAAVSGLPFTDFEGNPRHWESAPDIGCDEWVARLAGTGDDLVLVSEVNGLWPLAGTNAARPDDVLDIGLYTPSGTLLGGVPYVAASLHPTGFPPAPNPVLPPLWIDPSAFVILVDGPAAHPGGLTEAGVQLSAVLPPALAGTTLRFQAAAFSPAAGNHALALTDAHDVAVY